MSAKLVCTELILPWFKVNAMAFLPGQNLHRQEMALFTHGYTSHKGDCLNWATRLVENGIPCMIFDQPGHYLGSFHQVESLEDFKGHVHKIFGEAYRQLLSLLPDDKKPTSLILGGHSLGGLTAIKALELSEFNDLQKLAIGIGVGIGQRQATHLFETAFYEKTLAIRKQLVSPVLDPREIFSWLKEEKEFLKIKNQRIHLITGEDDLVVGKGGVEAFVEVLEEHGNQVTWERPKRLPHHEPGTAGPHLFAFLKNHFSW